MAVIRAVSAEGHPQGGRETVPDPLYEVMCRGPSKCGTFVSGRELQACPKCGEPKVTARAVALEAE